MPKKLGKRRPDFDEEYVKGSIHYGKYLNWTGPKFKYCGKEYDKSDPLSEERLMRHIWIKRVSNTSEKEVERNKQRYEERKEKKKRDRPAVNKPIKQQPTKDFHSHNNKKKKKIKVDGGGKRMGGRRQSRRRQPVSKNRPRGRGGWRLRLRQNTLI
jgi:hypothetical protein